MGIHIVTVWQHQFEIIVTRLSKTVWRATGTYHGQLIEAKGRSETAARNSWIERATHLGNP